MMTAKEISQRLTERAEEIAKYLLPNGKKEGCEWCVGSINGETGQSLKVHLTGDKSGVWCDFATGDKGDLLDLWIKKRNLTISEAIKEVSQYLGISLPKFDPYRSPNYVKPALIGTTLDLVNSSPVMRYLIEERKLMVETIRAYKICEKNREIVFPYWRDGELIFVKYLKLDRINGKKQITAAPNCEPCLFGWHLIPGNSRTITICEGEIDAMTLHQYGVPALSS